MTMANSASSSPQRGNISLRKTNKPLMEKRRRARINDSLTQLKTLVIHGSKKDSSQFNKLEKADILELTVKHLRTLQEQQQQQQLAQANESTLTGKYQAGFMECANEVIRYLGQSQGFSDDTKTRVIHHLASCIQLSNKAYFTKPVHANIAPASSASANGVHTSNAQSANERIAQVVSSQIKNIKPANSAHITAATSQPVPIAPASSRLSVSSSTTIPVVIATDPVSITQSMEASHIRYTQPLHIQIPQVLSPVAIYSRSVQQVNAQPQVIHKTQDTLSQIVIVPQQETLVSSSSTPSPRPTETILPSPPVPAKSYYAIDNHYHYADYMPRSRTCSLTSSSSESELTSPLNLSQSPQYYDQQDSKNYYSSPLGNNFSQTSSPDQTSPNRQPPFSSQYPFSKFQSVIVDGRKTVDNHSLKYMHMMDEDRFCLRHDANTSPASSVGEERLWRPW